MPDFSIAAAQVPSMRGDIDRNIAMHEAAIRAAAREGVAVLVFPELSLTGYEPDLGEALALSPDDGRLEPLGVLAARHRMDVIAGAPLRTSENKPAIGAIIFGADGARRTYLKMHLGEPERRVFAPGHTPLTLITGEQTIGIGICADSSCAAHPQFYADAGAQIYAIGVFLNAEWYASDARRFAPYAAQHRMLVVMANHAASQGTYVSVGRSAIWGPDGACIAQAPDVNSALVIATRRDGTWRGGVVEI